MNYYIENMNIKRNLTKSRSAIITSFLIGVTISGIPFVKNTLDELNYRKSVLLEKEMTIKAIENLCKSDDSNYLKLYNLGFPLSAQEEFDNCMKSNLKELEESI